MPLQVKCSAGHLMMVPDHRAGTVLRCAQCGIDVQVPPAPGTELKESTLPRVNAPVRQRLEVRQSTGPAARKSPRVSGHDAATPAVHPPAPTIKRPNLLPTKPAAPPVEVQETPKPAPIPAPEPVAAAASVVEPLPAADTPPVVEPPPVVAPPPVLAAAPAVTKQVPPKVPEKPAEEPSNRPRRTLTGTILSPNTDRPPDRVQPEPPAPAKRQPSRPEPAPAAARAAGTRVERPREQPAVVVEKHETPSTPSPSLVEPTPPPVAAPPVSPSQLAATVDQSPPVDEPPPPPQVVVLGTMPTPAQRVTVWQLAAAFLGALALSIGPSVWEISDYLQSENGHSVARWAFLLLMLGVVQFGAILLLVQAPDWSSVWIVTLQSLVLAAIYAAILGLTIITGGDSTLISTLQLDFQYASGKAPPWCVCMSATYACLAFFAGRISSKWRRVHQQLQAADMAAFHA